MAEVKVFKFEELSNEVKDVVIANWHGDMQIEYDMHTEYMVDYVQEHFDSQSVFVQWELHSQGSGVNIHGRIWYCDLLNKPEIIEGMTDKEVARLAHYTEMGANYVELPENSRYSYCKVDECEIAGEIIDYLEDANYSGIDYKLIERFDKAVKAYIESLCGKLYNMTLDWEHETWTYEYMQEVCDSNDYVFDEEGNII